MLFNESDQRFEITSGKIMKFVKDMNRNPDDENLNVGLKEMIDFSLYSRKGLKLVCSRLIIAIDAAHLTFFIMISVSIFCLFIFRR